MPDTRIAIYLKELNLRAADLLPKAHPPSIEVVTTFENDPSSKVGLSF
jgi:hypothetical protein